MAKSTGPDARQQRLAAKLKENLHRRKAQSRARKAHNTGDSSTPRNDNTDSASSKGER